MGSPSPLPLGRPDTQANRIASKVQSINGVIHARTLKQTSRLLNGKRETAEIIKVNVIFSHLPLAICIK